MYLIKLFSSSEQPVAGYLTAGVIILLIAAIVSIMVKRHRAIMHRRQKEEEKRRINARDRKLTAMINNDIAIFNRLVQSVTERAISYGDIVTPQRIDPVTERMQEIVDTVHDYDTLKAALDKAFSEIKKIEADMEAHEKAVEQDLAEERAEREEKRKRFPYSDTKYFCSCTDRTDVKAMFRRLAKMYHPDSPGGSAEKYMEMQEEYHHIMGKDR